MASDSPSPPPEKLSKKSAGQTPMLQQYGEIKAQYPDAFLFYRMGDFYEMFFEDAVAAAPLLEVQLTSRDKNAADPIPMCGVPYHSAQTYIQKLLAHGKKVAICEQMEEPSQAKGLVRRAVTRVLTPALVGDPDLVSEETQNFLACAYARGEKLELCLLDLFSGEVRIGLCENLRAVQDLFLQLTPKELLVSSQIEETPWFAELKKLVPHAAITFRDLYFKKDGKSNTRSAVMAYLTETQKLERVAYLRAPVSLFESKTMKLDHTSVSTLEIVRTVKGDVDGPTLFNTLNFTSTPMGRRLLKEWLLHPLIEKKAIEERLDAVDNLLVDLPLQEKIRGHLAQMRDLERLNTKTALGLAMPRDLVAIRGVLQKIPLLKKDLQKAKSSRLREVKKSLNDLSALTQILEDALEDSPSATLRDGGIFRSTYTDEIATLRSLAHDGKSTIASMEQRERTRTRIPTLKIKYSRVFGYTIEITRSHLDKVPPDYTRKQTIANGERFVTAELKDFEQKVLSAEGKLRSLEEKLFLKLRNQTAGYATELAENARLIAELDGLLSFALAAHHNGYHRPRIKSGWDLKIEDGRHPVVESLLPKGDFVPNSIHFSKDSCRTLIITGPNMAGKSTIMRQVALITLMAHAGCYVPATSADIPLVDAIYTRIGSSDDLAAGRSTFMVEMTEVARILREASHRSLIVIDEIGRGTSTYDGLSLAWALIEYLHAEVRAKTLFATHFHEITSLEDTHPGIRNANVLVEHWEDTILFLHRLSPGVCSKSYGIEVAGLAELPGDVLSRAKEILGKLEGQSLKNSRSRSHALAGRTNQMTFF